MPTKSANVKNEKQYEALKDKGMSKRQRREDRQLAEGLEARRREVASRLGQEEPGRDHRPAQGGGSQRW